MWYVLSTLRTYLIPLKNEREDILTISVYPSYFVVQYLGDNNGNVMYMKSSLANVFVKENVS